MSSDDRKDPTSERAPGRDGDLLPDEPPDAPVDARELSRAAAFGALVDRLVAGQPLPPAMTPEERALIETAGIVRASARPVALAADRQAALIDSVLGSVLGSALGSARGSALGSVPAPAGAPEHGADAPPASRADVPAERPAKHPAERQDDVIDMRGAAERRRARFFRVLPWSVATAAVAAALALVLWQRGALSPATPSLVADTAAPTLDSTHRSRPASDLVGEIPRERADAARSRIDMIYADRMIGYRDLRLRGGRL
jgi:hypothetical protein